MGTLAVGTKAVLATEKTTFTKLLHKKKDRTEHDNFFPLTGGCSEGLGAFRFFFKLLQGVCRW